MFNIAQVGVDKKSGAPIIQRSSNFIYNNDPNGTRDIFYYFGSRLRSSSWINPNSTTFLTASRISGGSVTGPANNAIDNNPQTVLFADSNNETDGVQVHFRKAPFKLLDIQINANDPNWVIEASNDGSNWTTINYPGFGNLGNNWYLLNVTNNTFFSYYRIVHGEPGFTKTLGTIKFFGEYQSGDIAPGITEDATFLATHRAGPGIIYLPDAGAEAFPENFYTTIVHFKTGEYTYQAFPAGGTTINDNTNGVLRQGEQLLAVFDNGNWELFKVGSGVDLTTKGTLLSSNGSETTFLSVGPNGSFLVADSNEVTGLKYQSVNLTTLAPPTAPVDFAGYRLTNVGAPSSPSDAVTKNYADSIAAGFDPKASCDIATTGDLDSITGLTWSPSGTGQGKTLTSNGPSASIDTITLQNGLRVLVKDQPNAADNGIYIVSGTGTAVTLTRSIDFDTSTKVTPGAFTFITKGIANGATGFILLGNGTLVIDTNDLIFSQFAGAGAVTLASLPDTSFGTLDSNDTGRLVGWNNNSGFFELNEKAGTETGDLVKLIDNNSTPAYPPLDGTLISISPTQVSPLNTKGDLWTYGVANTRQPIGTDGQILVASSSTGTGLIWKTISSTDFNIGADATDVTINFKTGTDSVELGPLHIDDSLSPSTDEFLRYDGTKFTSVNPTGTSIGDLVVLGDVGGQPGLPAVDGSQLTNVVVDTGQGSPLNTKGDLYVYDTDNTSLPIGNDNEILTVDSVASSGLSYKNIREVSRFYKDAVNNGGIPINFTANGAADDIIQYIGTEEGTQAFVNPHTANLLTITSSADVSPNTVSNNSTNIVDKATTTASFSANSSNIVIDTKKEDYVLLKRLSFKIGFSLDQIGSTGNFIVRVGATYEDARTGSNGAETLIDVDPNTLGWSTGAWFNYDFTPIGAYRYIYIRWSSQIVIEEIELYGEVSPAPLSYNLTTEDEKSTIVVPPVVGASIILPVGLPQGFIFFVQNRGITKTILSSDGSSIVLGNSVIYNQGDILLVTNIGSDTWISSNISSIQLTSRGELLGFSNKPQVLPPASSGKVLTSNSSSELGFRWEDRAGADDLIYAKEIPFSTLSHSINDIFEYIGRDKDINFTSTFSNPSDGTRIITETNSNFGGAFDEINSLTDQSNSGNVLQLQLNAYGEWHFQTVTIQPNTIAVYSQSNSADTDWDVQVSKDGGSWTTVGTLKLDGSSDNTWVLADLDTNGYYSYLRVINNGTNPNVWVNEVKLFGWVKDNPQLGEVFAVGSGGITPVKAEANNLLLVSDDSQPSGIKWGVVPSSAQSILTLETKIEPGTISYSSNGFNGIINAIGTKDGTEAFTNPHENQINITGRVNTFGTPDTPTAEITNQTLTGQAVSFGRFGIGTPHVVFTIDFQQTDFIKPSNILIYSSEELPDSGSDPNASFTFEGSSDNISWTELGSLTIGTGDWNVFEWRNLEVTQNLNSTWRYVRVVYNRTLGGNSSSQLGRVYEIELYGEYITSIPTGTLNVGDLGKFLVASDTTNPYSLKIPDNNSGEYTKGWFCYLKTNTGNNKSIISEVNQASIQAQGSIAFLNGPEQLAMIVNTDGANQWSVVNLSKQLPKTTKETQASSAIVLTNSDEQVQIIDPNGANREVILPDPPDKNLYFKIINSDAGNFNIDIKESAAGSVIKTLDIDTPYVECHRTQNNWIILD